MPRQDIAIGTRPLIKIETNMISSIEIEAICNRSKNPKWGSTHDSERQTCIAVSINIPIIANPRRILSLLFNHNDPYFMYNIATRNK